MNMHLIKAKGLEFPILPGVENPDGSRGRIRVGIVCRGCDAADALQSGNGGVSQAWSIKRFKQKGWTIGKDRKHDLCPKCTEFSNSAKGAKIRRKVADAYREMRDGVPVTEAAEHIRGISYTELHAATGTANTLKDVLDRSHPPQETTVKPQTPFLPKIISDEPRQMGRDDRRIVFEKLNDVYVDEKTGYSDGWSDKRVSEELGCPQKWVETVREEMFGPVKTNDEALKLVAELGQASTDAFKLGAEIKDLEVQIREGIQRLRDKQTVLSEAVNRLNKVARTVEKLY